MGNIVINCSDEELWKTTEIAKNCGELFAEKMNQKKGNIHLNEAEHRLVFMYTKAFRVFKSIELLSKEKYIEEAKVTRRSLIELCINISYILKDNIDENIERYIAFEKWKKYNYFKKMIPKYPRQFAELAKKQGRMKQMQKEANLYIEKYKKSDQDKKYWSGKSIENMAKDTGFIYDYDTIYRMDSLYSHPSWFGVTGYRSADKNTLVSLYPESNQKSQEKKGNIIAFAMRYYFYIMLLLNNYFKVNMKKEIDRDIDEIQKILKDNVITGGLPVLTNNKEKSSPKEKHKCSKALV